MSYNHLSITERELILIHLMQGLSLCRIAKLPGRHKSTNVAARNVARTSYLKIRIRLKLENYPIQISYKTIYRAIYAGMFDTPEQKRSEGNRGARRKLRHHGKPRRLKGYVSNRGKIPISHELSERPIAANERIRRGDWEADSIVGFNRKSGFLTLVDRNHGNVTATLGVEFYFPPPHQPWQRGTSR